VPGRCRYPTRSPASGPTTADLGKWVPPAPARDAAPTPRIPITRACTANRFAPARRCATRARGRSRGRPPRAPSRRPACAGIGGAITKISRIGIATAARKDTWRYRRFGTPTEHRIRTSRRRPCGKGTRASRGTGAETVIPRPTRPLDLVSSTLPRQLHLRSAQLNALLLPT